MNYASPFSTTPLRGPLPVLHTSNSSWRGGEDDVIQLSRRSSRPGASDLDDLDDPGAKGSKAGADTEPPGGGVLQTLPRTSQQSASQRRQQRRLSSHSPVDRMPRGRWAKVKWFFQMQLKYLGPGITMSVAYCDPGNWSTDLQAGSQFGYPLLFVILLTGIFGIILQVLSLRMGIVCNNDLAVLTRKWVMGLGKNKKCVSNGDDEGRPSSRASNLEDLRSTRTRRSLWAHRGRVALLWTLYIVAEGAIICTELAELVGSAIALTLLFPKLPLWGGVIITSADVFLILFVYRPDTKGLRMFELCIGVLVLVVISCLVALVVKVQPHWPDVFEGYLPSSDVVGPQALYVGIGILGATCMPHGLFLGSHFAMFEREEQLVSDLRDTQTPGGETGSDDGGNDDDAVSCASHRQPDAQSGLPTPSSTSALPAKQSRAARLRNAMHRLARSIPGVDPSVLGIEPDPTSKTTANKAIAAAKGPRPLPTLRSLNRRLLLSTIDVTASLLLFALTTNSALLIVAAQAFYYGFGRDDQEGGTHGSVVVGDLFEAFSLLSSRLNHASALLFAIALLAAGQSASITVTLAGQVISEGMIKWRTNPFLRRCVTRAITLVPSFVVAAAVGRGGLDRMLVASQVALSMALPFVLVPLLVITAREGWMTVRIRGEEEEEEGEGGEAEEDSQRLTTTAGEEGAATTATSHGRWARARHWYTHRLMRNRAQPQQRRRASISAYPRSSSSSSSSDDDEAEAATTQQRSSNATVTVVHYASSWPLVAATFAIFVLICICDVFVLVTSKQSLEGN